KDISKKIQLFLYKTLHNTHCIGSFWENIPTYEIRATCLSCRAEMESIEHILTTCDHLAPKAIWSLTHQLWPENYIAWNPPTIGTILGCRASHLLHMLISESMHMIWALHCERAIKGVEHSDINICTRWIHAISQWLNIDRMTAHKYDRRRKVITKVINMWSHVINTEPPDNTDCMITPEVLVGIKLPRPLQN
ncbi:hypothetical protein DFH29DRAFT_787091, partial [Suillus ampliporus]